MEAGRTTARTADVKEVAVGSEAPARQLDSRSGQRTNLFVAAVLYSEEGNCPVKVRNLSESGALIEAATLPPVGTAVRLCRGSLAVPGKVVWQRAGKAGLRFGSAIRVADWLPSNRGRHQSHVDELVHQVRTERAGVADVAIAEPRSNPPLAPEQIDTIASTIERLADEFAADPYVIANHSWKLQQLEGAVQQLRRIVCLGSLKV